MPKTQTPPRRETARLSAKWIAALRESLLDKREQLAAQVGNLAQEAAGFTEATQNSKSPLNIAENAADSYGQDFAFLSIESAEKLLEHVERALERIQEGAYSRCEDCEAPIPLERLECMPWAAKCVKCQVLEEQGRLAREPDGGFEILEEHLEELHAGDEKE